MKKKINALFFSRGRGHGHAIPDMAIASALAKRDPEISIRFVSYATGASTFARAKWPVIDLHLPEANPYLPTLLIAEKLIATLKPDVIISHEEFAAIPAARSASLPSIYVAAWLPKAGTIGAESLALAESIVVIESAGVFALPAGLTIKNRFTGPILRELKCGIEDRARLRAQFEIEETALVILVVPGGWANETRAPMADLMKDAFEALPAKSKSLIWLTSETRGPLQATFASAKGVRILDYYDPIEELLAVSDIVITKGGRGITLDAAAIGVPSLSISHGQNPIDDILVPRMRSNTALFASALTKEHLAGWIEKIVAKPAAMWKDAIVGGDIGGVGAAEAIGDEIRRLSPG